MSTGFAGSRSLWLGEGFCCMVRGWRDDWLARGIAETGRSRHPAAIWGAILAVEVVIWSLAASSFLIIGALVGWSAGLSHRLIASLLAFGGGILISVAAFELLEEAHRAAGIMPVIVGYVTGAVLFAFGLRILDRAGARHRKRTPSGAPVRLSAAAGAGGSSRSPPCSTAFPESLIIGLNFSEGKALGFATVIAVLLSNFPEGVASTARMKAEGRSFRYVIGLWICVALVSGGCAWVGYHAFGDLPKVWVAFIEALAAGALFVYVADHMVPEAFAETHEAAGLITALGFLLGFGLAEGMI